MRKLSHGLIVILLLGPAGPAAAQPRSSQIAVPFRIAAPLDMRESRLPDFFALPAFSNELEPARRSGLVAAMPLSDRLTLGVGRFRAIELARPRTNVEPDPRPTDMRRREHGMAAVGFICGSDQMIGCRSQFAFSERP